jgi:hypothetical protein
MKLPCRHCVDIKGELPITAFTAARDYKEIWRVCISKGQLLTCYRCARQLGFHVGGADAIISCDLCWQMKTQREFAPEMRRKWAYVDEEAKIICKSCSKDKSREEDGSEPLYTCCGLGCSSEESQARLPALHFITKDLIEAQLQNRSAKCGRCLVLEDASNQVTFQCTGCEVMKRLTDFSVVACKQFLLGDRRSHLYRCTACQYPKCGLCDTRPDLPISPNHLEADGKWYCRFHRYPPCSVCRITARPPGFFNYRFKFKDWVCRTCQEPDGQNPTSTSRQNLGIAETTAPSPDQQETFYKCTNCTKRVTSADLYPKQHHDSDT